MSIISLITPSESDVFNVLSPVWIALTDPEKEAFIFNSSVYMQLNWDCESVEWDDPSTLDNDLKKACAFFAEADRIGVLFDEMKKEDVHGKKTMFKEKLEGLEEITQWSMFGQAVNGNPLDSVNAIMKMYCTSISNSTTLIRN